MKFSEVLKDIDLTFGEHKNEDLVLTYCIDHTKVLASLDRIKIIQYKEGDFTVWIYDPLGSKDGIVYKAFKTLKGIKQFITKVVQDEQQRTYQDLIFCKQM